MKKHLLTIVHSFGCLMLLMAIGMNARAQALSGTKTIPGTYASLSLAIADLNANGVGAGGVIFNISAGYTETLSATLIITATGTAANPITFQKNGGGANPLITAYATGTATPTSAVPDGIWALSGSDYVTIDGIDLLDPATNTTVATSMEYGYALFKASATDGARNNTIKNCTVTLNALNNTAWTVGHNGSCGIIIHNTTQNLATTAITVTAPTGSNSFNRFYSNTVQKANAGIVFVGFGAASPYTLGDTLNDIGGSLIAQGNTIKNYGGGGTANPATGIFLSNQWGANVSNNTINNNDGGGVNHATTLRGIFLSTAAGASANVNGNTVTIKGGGTTSQLTAIENAFGSTPNNNTINISNNTIINCSYQTATSGVFYGIYNTATPATVTIKNNQFTNDSTGATSGTYAPIYNAGALISGTVNIDSNTISGLRFTASSTSLVFYGVYNTAAATGTTMNVRANKFQDILHTNMGSGVFALIYFSGSLTTGTENFLNNNFNNLTAKTTGSTYLIYCSNATHNVNIIGNYITTGFNRAGTSGTYYGTYNFGSPTAGTTLLYNNNFSNVTLAGTTICYSIYYATVTTHTQLVRKNTLDNYIGGSGTTWGIFYNYGNAGSTCDSNIITNYVAGGIIYGIQNSTSSTLSYNYNNNYIRNLSGTSANLVVGINITSGAYVGMFNNTISNLNTTNAGGTVNGILISGGTDMDAYNNLIGNLTGATVSGANQIIGFSLTKTSGTLNMYNNSIHVDATSSATNFGSSALSAATGVTLLMQGNIFVNKSVPNGTGRSVAYRRSSTTLTSYGALSNNNIFYAGDSTLAMRTIFFDGTNIDTLMSAYKTRVGASRDSASYTENITFLNTTGGVANFLKPDPTIMTYVEAGGIYKAVLGLDNAGTVRPGFGGYTGTSGLPDIGAVEGEYLGNPINNMVIGITLVDQITGIVPKGATNKAVLRVNIKATLGYNAGLITSFKLTGSGSTAMVDIANAKIYATGSDSNFTTNQLIGTTATPASTFYITGNKRLAAGNNYYWVVYDVNVAATAGNFLDATLDSILISGINYTPVDGNPAGNLLIKAPLNGNYNIGSSQIYPTLTAAAGELSLLGVSGPVTFTLTDVLYNTGSGEIFPITLLPHNGSSSVNTVKILPGVGVAARIESANATATLDLNGIDNLTIDGRQGGTGGFTLGNNLIIANTNANGPAIRLINGATANKILYADLRSNNVTATGTVGAGVVNFGTTNEANGNDNNTIKFCDIHEETGGNPLICISAIGSAASVAANNDLNIVDSNNLYNFFNAATASAAVYVGANNGSWAITNNHVYQTASLTYTGAVTHRAFWITPNTASLTSASGFTISNNFIGGNSSVGSGMYTMGGAVAYVFNGMDISVGVGTATSVQGNTISNIDMTSASTASNAFVAINIANGNVNMGTLTGNIIGSKTNYGAITYTTTVAGGGVIGIRVGAGGTMNIRKNTINGINIGGNATTAYAEFFGINLVGGTTVIVDSNMVGSTNMPNGINHTSTSATATGAARISGIIVNPSAATLTHTITNNTIANINSNYTATGTQAASVKGIHITPTGTGCVFTVNNNLVYNLSTASQTTGSGLNSTLLGIAISSTANEFTLIQNTVHSLTLTTTATVGSIQATGLFYSTASSGVNIVNRNMVHSLAVSAMNPGAVITGMDIAAGNGLIINNMIRMGIDSTGTATTVGCSIRGITKNSGSNNIYFNTVYIGGAGVGPDTNSTFAFQRSGAGTDDIRNNIFSNQRTNAGSGAGHFAIGLNNATTLTQNYNLLRGDSIGRISGAGAINLQTWKSLSGVDANSVSSAAGLINPAGDKNTFNLHINAANPTPIEAYGVAVTGIGTDVDFDGQTRSGLTPIDLGADAGNFTPIDIAPPAITYTPLTNTASTGNRVINATITDISGIYFAGVLQPRIYYKKMAAGVYVSAQGVRASGTKTNSVWNFTINAASIGGLVGDDSVYYYVVAQDSTGGTDNLGSFPGGVQGTNVNTISVAPNPYGYKITPTIGPITYQVGTGQTYTTLTGSGGLFNYINTASVNGNITIQITSDIEEPGTFDLKETTELGAGGYTITIVPDAAVMRSITGSVAAGALIRLSGTDRVVIDGRFAGSGRYLRFMNRPQGAVTIRLDQDADKNTIRNCIVEGTANIGGTILFGGSSKVGGTGNDSNSIINCIIRDTLGSITTSNIQNTGINSTGTAVLLNDWNTIDSCEIYNFGFNAINLTATGTGDFWKITNNKIYQIIIKNNKFDIILVQGGSGHVIVGNSIGGAASDRSGAAFQTSPASALDGINGIMLAVGSTPVTQVTNNTISNIGVIGTVGGVVSLINVTAGSVNIESNTLGGGMMPHDTVRNGYDNGIITISSTSPVTVNNNLISNVAYYRALGDRNSAMTISAGTHTITNNTIRNIKSNSTSTGYTFLPIGIYLSGGISHIVRGNTISDIASTATTSGAYPVVGIIAGVDAMIEQNRISNVYTLGTGTGTSSPIVSGIYVSGANNSTIRNNQITLGDNTILQSRVYGIQDASTGAPVITNNSILIKGAITSGGANNSYGILRTSTSSVNARNNIIYNKRRTDGTGKAYAVGSAGAITSANQNYNLIVVSDTAFMSELGGVGYGWNGFGTLYATTYQTNWITDSNQVLSTQLFNNESVGDLNIIPTNAVAWYANGKGIPNVGISGDYGTASGVRSTSIATGSVDIGSDEFTPTTLPPFAVADKVPAALDSTQFFVAGRMVAKAKWGAVGSVPSAVSLQYYSGVNAPSTPGGKTMTNAYWSFVPTGGSGYNYNLTLMADTAILGTVANLANLDIARYTGTGTTWNDLTNTTVNTVSGMMTSAGLTTAIGMYTGTDGSNNPLPVRLNAFTATTNGADVWVTWSTASEQNSRGFDIESSIDGHTFMYVGFVRGAGNSNRMLNYNLTDARAFAKANSRVLYYRLKQLDVNGAFTYSKVVRVENRIDNSNTVSVSPNPFTSEYVVSVNALQNGNSEIEMTDIQGRVVAKQTGILVQGVNTIQVQNIASIQAGVYFVKVTTNNETQVIKLVKE